MAEQLGKHSSAKQVEDFCTTKGWKDITSIKGRSNNPKVRAVSNILNKNRLTKRDLESKDPEKTIQVFKMFFFYFVNEKILFSG